MWLFGGRKEPYYPNDHSIDFSPAPGSSRFDSKSLEKAANSAKTLESSKYSQEILHLLQASEATQSNEAHLQMKEYESYLRVKDLEKLTMSDEDRQKKLQGDLQIGKQRTSHEDDMEKKRYSTNLQQQYDAMDKIKRLEEQTLLQDHTKRRAHMDRELSVKEQAELKNLEKKLALDAKLKRENHDLTMELIREEARGRRETMLQSIQSIGSLMGNGLHTFFTNWDMAFKAAGGITLTMLGLYGAKYSVGTIFKAAEARFFKPSLVLETSRISPWELLRHPIAISKRIKTKPKDVMKDIVLSPKLEEQLRGVAVTTRNTKANKWKYRNLMLFGPPGTGKTLFAKKLAYHSGMDYALMSGGNLQPLGRDGVLAVNKVFNWAETSRKGLLLTIDEADAFFQKRTTHQMSQDTRGTLSAFLAKTGELSDKFMLVLITNLPEQLDTAILNRMDLSVKFDLPGLEERKRLINLYFDKFILHMIQAGNSRLKVEPFDYNQLCEEIAAMTEGYSGREISKLVYSWLDRGFSSETGVVSRELILQETQFTLQGQKLRQKWSRDNELKRKYLELNPNLVMS